MSETLLIHYFQKHIDSLTVTQSLVHWAFLPPLFISSERDHAVLVALRHSDERLIEADRAGIQAYLQTFDEHHIVQLVSKIRLSTEKRKRLNLTNSTKILKIYLSRLKNSQRKRVSKKILSIQSI